MDEQIIWLGCWCYCVTRLEAVSCVCLIGSETRIARLPKFSQFVGGRVDRKLGSKAAAARHDLTGPIGLLPIRWRRLRSLISVNEMPEVRNNA